jgi:hypothetical protein
VTQLRGDHDPGGRDAQEARPRRRAQPRRPPVDHRAGLRPVITAITRLLDAGKDDGTIRQDADLGDFLQLTGALWRAASGPSDRSQPMLGLILDGLSTVNDFDPAP